MEKGVFAELRLLRFDKTKQEMQGLENQAQAESRLLVDRLCTHTVLEVKHSSRDSLMECITDAMTDPPADASLKTHTMIFRSGLSSNSLFRLQNALNRPDCPIRELQFVSLRNEEQIQLALQCCRQEHCKIERIRLQQYRPSGRLSREDRQSVAKTLRDGIFGLEFAENSGALPSVTIVELVGYPIGAEGARILTDAVAQNKTLDTLRLMDCDLRGDSMYYIAQMIRHNSHLRELDLSYNKHYLGSPLTQEMTIKTLVNKGLKYNHTLQQLRMNSQGGRINRSKIDRHLSVNRFCHDFVSNNRDPFTIPEPVWPCVIARVTAQPSALHKFLRENAVALFGN